jgi:hypothetical protein
MMILELCLFRNDYAMKRHAAMSSRQHRKARACAVLSAFCMKEETFIWVFVLTGTHPSLWG